MPQESLFDNTIETIEPKGATKAPSFFRAVALRRAPRRVDRSKGVIYGCAVCTKGEALGHDFWCDDKFLDQLVKLGNKRRLGVKSRFTHPGLSGDGLGKHLGRVRSFVRDGDVVRGDLHIASVASKSPDGDLADYVMSLAEEDPEAFGKSIVFSHDYGAEDLFLSKNRNEDGDFQSPDEGNVNNYPHARMAQLRASDVVGDPAANPGGFFSADTTEELAARAESVLAYAFGLSEDEPTSDDLGGIHPERLRTFVASFAERHGIRIDAEEPEMADKTEQLQDDEKDEKKDEEQQEEEKKDEEQEEKEEEQEEDEKKDEEEASSNLSALRANKTFGKDGNFVLEALESGWSVDKAETEYLRRQVKERDSEIAKLKNSGPAAGSNVKNDGDSVFDFMAEAKALAKANNSTVTQAMKQIAREKPEAYAQWKSAQK